MKQDRPNSGKLLPLHLRFRWVSRWTRRVLHVRGKWTQAALTNQARNRISRERPKPTRRGCRTVTIRYVTMSAETRLSTCYQPVIHLSSHTWDARQNALSNGHWPVARNAKHQQKNAHYQLLILSQVTWNTHRLGRATQRLEGLMATR